MLYLLDGSPPDTPFPDPTGAESDPNGLLAVGGDLTPKRLLQAYRAGVFPWFSEGQPILWWSPNPRMVLFPDHLKVSRSLRKTLRRGHYQVSIDQAFKQVIHACAEPRRDADGTWLVPQMISAYTKLHKLGMAHSVETWQDGELVGGLYGVALGKAFFGESMFSRADDASKVALVQLAELMNSAGYTFIDCQVYTKHLQQLGAEEIPRVHFCQLLQDALEASGLTDWPQQPRSTQYLEAAQ
jgi:leucyl/phenylalanyl-tRNA--protein transferase